MLLLFQKLLVYPFPLIAELLLQVEFSALLRLLTFISSLAEVFELPVIVVICYLD
jgi:hypothetical protein